MMRSLIVFILFTFNISLSAQGRTDISIVNPEGNIAYITRDSIILVKGSTYRYSVDTEDGKGLILTAPDEISLFRQLRVPSGLSLKLVHKAEGSGALENGDKIEIWGGNSVLKQYSIAIRTLALNGKLSLDHDYLTAGSREALALNYTVGQRSPDATVRFWFPAQLNFRLEDFSVDVIGRGLVKLRDLSTQYPGRFGSAYPYKKVGDYKLRKLADGRTELTLSHLDLRPSNGVDIRLVIQNSGMPVGKYLFDAEYEVSQPERLKSAPAKPVKLTVTSTVSDLRAAPLKIQELLKPVAIRKINWTPIKAPTAVHLSEDGGKTWKPANAQINQREGYALISQPKGDQPYWILLEVKDGPAKGWSNMIKIFNGKLELQPGGLADNTDQINNAIKDLSAMGGGILQFSTGTFNVRTIHLRSNVLLLVQKDAVIKALKGADAAEITWFSDRKYRSGLSPTDRGPYQDPENWLTKQDVGHHYFRNCMFYGERIENAGLIGNGRITGDGNLVTGDKVMSNAPDNRADKMFVFKLCRNIELGGLTQGANLWYDSTRDEPYYLEAHRKKAIDSMLHIDRAGHFVVLATGTDGINVHDTYLGKNSTSNVRDIYDFMGCNDVQASNIYCKVSSDDIVKLGSDCSLGFTRKSSNTKVRNIIGDTNCNLFQIGSETADDIQNVFVDNIYVLGANKAGFSISTNDGATVSRVYLNCGYTGTVLERSRMLRTTTPFFISISNRGRILGATVDRFKFKDGAEKHDELLVTNVNIGQVNNIVIKNVDVSEIYGGSSFGNASVRWKPYDGSQRKASAIVAGYALPRAEDMEGSHSFTLPDGRNTGYIDSLSMSNIRMLVKGSNPASDTSAAPPELGVGQYNVSNLKTQPGYGFWVRHARNFTLDNVEINFEKPDGRYALYFDDVMAARLLNLMLPLPLATKTNVGIRNSQNIRVN